MGAGLSHRGFWQALKHAFAIPGDPVLSPAEHAWLERIADAVVRRRLGVPAAFLLQASSPLSFVGSQALVFLKPVISAVLPPEQCDRAIELLSRHGTVEILVDMIQQRQPCCDGAPPDESEHADTL